MEPDLKKLAENVLQDGFVMSLGTHDDSGVWVADVIYVYDDSFNIYWTSLAEVRHSKAIMQNTKVACTITADWTTGKERALQIEGVAEKIEGAFFELEKQLRVKRHLAVPTEPGQILEGGYSWHVLRPTKIELINNELFGYEKKNVEFFV